MRWEKEDSSITGIVGGWTTAAGRQESRPRRHGAGLAICSALADVGFEEQEKSGCQKSSELVDALGAYQVYLAIFVVRMDQDGAPSGLPNSGEEVRGNMQVIMRCVIVDTLKTVPVML